MNELAFAKILQTAPESSHHGQRPQVNGSATLVDDEVVECRQRKIPLWAGRYI
jgi:hypothetical protein